FRTVPDAHHLLMRDRGMSTPTTVPDFLALVAQSGLVDEPTLARYARQRRMKLDGELGQAVDVLVHDTLLTRFQAQQLLRGKWRGFTIGRYKVLDRIGTGGMASVYLCEHLDLHRRVALKVLSVGQSKNPASLERFYREARAVARLDHPNVVKAFDFD